MLRQVTKILFCRKQAQKDVVEIVDGEIEGDVNATCSPPDPSPSPVDSGSNSPEIVALPDKTDKNCDTPPAPPDSGVPEAYFVYLGASGRSPGTMNEYRIDLNWWLRKKNPLHVLSRHEVEQAINGMQAATARRKVASLRSYAGWLLREGHDSLFVTLSQIELPRLPGRVPRDRGPTSFRELADQAEELVAGKDRRGIWLGLMLCCGLRISEVQTASPAPGSAVRVTGKGNRERLVPAPCWLRSAVSDQKGFTTWRRDRKLIWHEMKKMGITHPHSLRHTYASELVRQGFALEQVQQLLGHARLETSLVYAQVRLPEDVPARLGLEGAECENRSAD
jgi:site-specific recombinase XerD